MQAVTGSARSGALPYLVVSSSSYAPQLRSAFHQQVEAIVAQFLTGSRVGVDT